MPSITITLNGLNENPWHKQNLRQNPFPQLGKLEYESGERALASLDGDPLRSEQDIRDRLDGYVTDELIELCVRQFRLGERVRFKVDFPV